jgi:hypothetical protein
MKLVEPERHKHGLLTAKVARELSQQWKEPEYQVLYDHDPASETVGKVVSSFGDLPYDRATQLGHIDIAIVEPNAHDRVVALIEIEETTGEPKAILGDVLGVLMGEHISFGKQRQLLVNERTHLLVIVRNAVSNEERNNYLLTRIMKIKPGLLTANSRIERIDIENFSSESELFTLLASVLRPGEDVLL